MRARRFIASLAVSLVLAAGLVPAAAFADDALGDVDSPRAAKATSAAESGAATESSATSSAAQVVPDSVVGSAADVAAVRGLVTADPVADATTCGCSAERTTSR